MDLETIYRLYFRDVYRYVRALSQNEHLAEKIAQETFARALRAVDRFDGRGDVRAWLFTIAKNAWVDHCRRHRRETELPGEDLPGGGDLPDLLLGPPRGRRGGGGLSGTAVVRLWFRGRSWKSQEPGRAGTGELERRDTCPLIG